MRIATRRRSAHPHASGRLVKLPQRIKRHHRRLQAAHLPLPERINRHPPLVARAHLSLIIAHALALSAVADAIGAPAIRSRYRARALVLGRRDGARAGDGGVETGVAPGFGHGVRVGGGGGGGDAAGVVVLARGDDGDFRADDW
ncbi:hypothetical protein V493_01732, partial [Pseudogymnoascus sp. VKM F-4281 (FW-2241)]